MSSQYPQQHRPAQVTEIRAWLLAGIAVAAHTVAISWWGATLTAKVDYLTQIGAAAASNYKDLEVRVRLLETHAAKKDKE